MPVPRPAECREEMFTTEMESKQNSAKTVTNADGLGWSGQDVLEARRGFLKAARTAFKYAPFRVMIILFSLFREMSRRMI
jgi:hypothetical protein